MQNFEYIQATSVAEVTGLLSQDGIYARILAGGTDLIVQLREKRTTADLLIDIKSLPETTQLRYTPQHGLIIGAAVTCARLCADKVISTTYPGLIDAVCLVGGTQIQNRATIGGNLCNASPAADTIPALIVHNAFCTIAGPNGIHQLPVEDFCTSPGQNILRKGEFLVSLGVPSPEPNFGAAYLRFTPRNEMDIGIAGAGVSIVLNDELDTILTMRIALSAVGPTPLCVGEACRVLTGRSLSAETIQVAARLAEDAAQPIADLRGGIAQRKHLAAVLTKRALKKAIDRVRGR